MTSAIMDFVTHTPPKYANMLDRRNDRMLLEDRLTQFINWLIDRGVQMSWHDPNSRVTEQDRARLVKEFVDS